MPEVLFRTPASLDEALRLARVCKTNPGRLKIMLMAWAARGMDLNEPLDGQSLLHAALLGKEVWLVRGLLEAGANPMTVSQGRPAFLQAAYWNESEAVVAMLQDARLDPQVSDTQGNTAAHFAALNNNEPLVLALVEKGCSLFAVNEAGQTAMDLLANRAGHAVESFAVQAEAFALGVRPLARQVQLDADISPAITPQKKAPRF